LQLLCLRAITQKTATNGRRNIFLVTGIFKSKKSKLSVEIVNKNKMQPF